MGLVFMKRLFMRNGLRETGRKASDTALESCDPHGEEQREGNASRKPHAPRLRRAGRLALVILSTYVLVASSVLSPFGIAISRAYATGTPLVSTLNDEPAEKSDTTGTSEEQGTTDPADSADGTAEEGTTEEGTTEGDTNEGNTPTADANQGNGGGITLLTPLTKLKTRVPIPIPLKTAARSKTPRQRTRTRPPRNPTTSPQTTPSSRRHPSIGTRRLMPVPKPVPSRRMTSILPSR